MISDDWWQMNFLVFLLSYVDYGGIWILYSYYFINNVTDVLFNNL